MCEQEGWLRDSQAQKHVEDPGSPKKVLRVLGVPGGLRGLGFRTVCQTPNSRLSALGCPPSSHGPRSHTVRVAGASTEKLPGTPPPPNHGPSGLGVGFFLGFALCLQYIRIVSLLSVADIHANGLDSLDAAAKDPCFSKCHV